jgi:tetratricopeptide (TPR) repeat protein
MWRRITPAGDAGVLRFLDCKKEVLLMVEMKDQHLTVGMLLAIHESPAAAARVAGHSVDHLRSICPPCDREWAAAEEAVEARRQAPAGAPYAEPYARALATAAVAEGPIAEERRRAEEAARALAALPASRRLEAVRSDPDHFTGPALADLLLNQARGHLPGYPKEAFAAARLARVVLDQTPSTPYVVELYALAVAHMANAHRVLGDLPGAARGLRAARALLVTQGAPDPEVEAEIDSLEGSLLRAQRRLPEAAALLLRAAATYRRQGSDLGAGRALLKLAKVHQEEGDLDRAATTTRAGLALLEGQGEPRLLLYGQHNLADFLREAGRLAEAHDALSGCARLYRDFPDPLSRLRGLWIEAHLAQAEGKQAVAEGLLQAVRGGFLREGAGYDAALVTLDLALLYAEEGRPREVRGLAEALLSLFESQGIHREAAAALLLFVQAARREEAGAALLRQLGSYLKEARLDPSLSFRPDP